MNKLRNIAELLLITSMQITALNVGYVGLRKQVLQALWNGEGWRSNVDVTVTSPGIQQVRCQKWQVGRLGGIWQACHCGSGKVGIQCNAWGRAHQGPQRMPKSVAAIPTTTTLRLLADAHDFSGSKGLALPGFTLFWRRVRDSCTSSSEMAEALIVFLETLAAATGPSPM